MEVRSMSAATGQRTDRGDVLGVKVSAITMDDAIATLERWIEEDAREYVCVTGVHGIMEAHRDPEFRCALNMAMLVGPDGGQAGTLVREVMDDAARGRLVSNIVGALLAGVTEPVLQRAFWYLGNVDKDLGDRVEKGVRAGQ